MKWAEMTPRQRDELVHEKVMGHRPDEPCTGQFTFCDPEHDGLYCPGCGAQVGWCEEEYHLRPIPPAYTTRIDVAWRVLEKMHVRMEAEFYLNRFAFYGPRFKPSHQYLTNEGYPLGTTCWYVCLEMDGLNEYICAHTAQDAICIAALRACGVEIEVEGRG